MQPHTQATPDRGGGDARLSADSSDSESSSGSEASGSDAELAAGAARTSDQSANTDRRKSGKQRVKSQDGRANKMVARHYSKIVERLTRISLTLEDPSSVAPMRKKATPPSTTTWTPTTGPRPACWTSTSGRPTSYAAS
eukprot:GHVT01020388.1.p1 GENE.GHVT01020388.1~~GHVT01020388.1.p1  ORF type:complete len:139 (+),score=31.27 GHVT01020388.1:356-772(+)